MATTTGRSDADVLFGDAAGVQPAVDARAAATPTDAPWATNVERDLYGADYPEPTDMFPVEVGLRPVLAQRQDELMDVLELGQAARIQRHREFVAAVRESGLEPSTVGQALYNVWTDAEIAAARGTLPDTDDDDGSGWEPALVEDITRTLRNSYGPARAERLLVAAQTFVAEHPRLARVLQTPGIKTRPGFRLVVDQIVEHVRQQQHL